MTIELPAYLWMTLGMMATFPFTPDRRSVRLGLWGAALVAQFLALPYSLAGTLSVDPHALIFGAAAFGDVLDGLVRLIRIDND